MQKFTTDFTVQVDGVTGVCPAGEAWAEDKIPQKKIPVLSCEGPCVRGNIARRAANFVAQEEPFARACFPSKILAHTICVFLNLMFGRPPLDLDGLVSA